MRKTIHLLLIEDVEDHALLIVRELQKGGYEPAFTRVETVQELETALQQGQWDAIFSDYHLSGFDALDVLRMVQERHLDLPFLLVSGTIGEEKAAEVMRAGAHDYIKKGNYARLVPVLERELQNNKTRRERSKSAEELYRHREQLGRMVQETTTQIESNEALRAENEEQKQVEEALRAALKEREQALLQLEAVLETINEGVVISDLKGNIVTMNQQALALLQFEAAKPAGQHLCEFQDWFELTDLEGGVIPFERWPLYLAVHGGQFEDYEVTVRNKDTGRIWVGSFSGSRACDKQGQCILAVVTIRDITARKRSEEERLKSQMKFMQVFNLSPSLMGITSLSEGKVIDANDATLKALGYVRAEVIGKTTSQLGLWVNEWDRSEIVEALKEKGSLRNLEVRYRDRYGQTLVGLFSGEVIDLDGEHCILTVVTDITERKTMEEALLTAKEEWECTFNSVPDLIAVLDDDFRIVRVNRAMAERLGRQPEECCGLPCYSTIHGAEAPLESCPHHLTRADGSEHEAVALESHLGGTFMITTTPLAHDGESKGVVYVARDLTEILRAEAEIARLNTALAARVAELEDRNQELDAFNRMISHDLRQPLNTMALACQEMKVMCKNQSEECQRAIPLVYKGVRSMNTLIDTLLTFSRSTQGDLRRQVFDLSEVVKEIFAELKGSDQKRHVTCKVPDDVQADGDPTFIRAVLQNLIGNAWKYTAKRDEAVIEVGVMKRGSTKVFFVRDNGKGFDMAHADMLFVPFARLPDSEEYPGSGIGLATVQRIIRRHGGRIWAEGELEKGATFYFTLS